MEIMITISILAIWFAGIFVMMQNSSTFVQQSRQKTLAINLTREAIEGLTNIRDTNRTRRSDQKDACRLKINPLEDSNDNGCQNDTRIQSWRYTVIPIQKENQQYFALSGISISWFDTVAKATDSSGETLLCQSGQQRTSCTGNDDQEKVVRAIHISWLFKKNSTNTGGTAINCPTGTGQDEATNTTCGSSDAKELRFCATTWILWNQNTQIQLCSWLTNFQE